MRNRMGEGLYLPRAEEEVRAVYWLNYLPEADRGLGLRQEGACQGFSEVEGNLSPSESLAT